MRVALLFAVLALIACTRAEPEAVPESYCNQQLFEGSRFTVCDNEGGELLLFAAGKGSTPMRSFGEVVGRVDVDRVAFGMNAGMFDEEGRAIGLATPTHGSGHPLNLRDGPGNFHMKPNGVFMVLAGGRPAIFESDKIPEFRAPPRLATQSGPMLVIDGKLHPRFEPDGRSRLIRNGVGITAEGKAVFVISEDLVSFGKFGRFFRDALKTPDALYFDGSVSSLWDPANGRQDSHAPLGPMIIALKPVESGPGHEGPAKP